jgi:acyl carrier protein
MTTRNDSHQMEEQIKNFIAQNLLYSVDGFTYSEEASFLQEGIIDSLGVMQLVEFVERDFDISVDQQEVTPDNFGSVGKLAGFVRRKLHAQTSSTSQ